MESLISYDVSSVFSLHVDLYKILLTREETDNGKEGGKKQREERSGRKDKKEREKKTGMGKRERNKRKER